MSDADDLLGKADAFLKRYRPASNAAQHDVPVLTEVIAEARENPEKPGAIAPSGGGPSGTDPLDLEQKLKQSILDAVNANVTAILEEPLKAHLDAHLQRALAAMSAQIKAEVETLVRETVARAVAAEITRMRGPSRGG